MSLETSRAALLEATEQLDALPVYIPSNVSVHVDLGPHGAASHLGPEGSFEALMQSADIYLHEDLGWNNYATRVFNRISNGDYRSHQRMDSILEQMEAEGDFTRRVTRAFYNTHVAVNCVDLGQDNPLFEDVRTLMPTSEGEEVPATVDLDESLLENLTQEGLVENYASGAHDWAIAINYRDKLMATRFGPMVQQIIETTPRLRGKDDYKVLMRIGGMHRNVFTFLREAHPYPDKVTTSSRIGEPALSEFQWLIRANSLGVDLTPDVVTRMALRGIFTQTTTEPSAMVFAKQWDRLNYYDRIRAHLRITSKLSNEELWAILDIAHPTELTEPAKSKAFDLVARHIGRTTAKRM